MPAEWNWRRGHQRLAVPNDAGPPFVARGGTPFENYVFGLLRASPRSGGSRRGNSLFILPLHILYIIILMSTMYLELAHSWRCMDATTRLVLPSIL